MAEVELLRADPTLHASYRDFMTNSDAEPSAWRSWMWCDAQFQEAAVLKMSLRVREPEKQPEQTKLLSKKTPRPAEQPSDLPVNMSNEFKRPRTLLRTKPEDKRPVNPPAQRRDDALIVEQLSRIVALELKALKDGLDAEYTRYMNSFR